MAYAQRQKTEHPFRTIARDLKEDRIPSVVLLCGTEDYLVDWARNLLTDRFVRSEGRALDLTVPDLSGGAAAIREACETLPVLSERKVVWVRDLPLFRGRMEDWFSADELEQLAAWLPETAPTTLLLFTAGGSLAEKGKKASAKKSALLNALKKHGRVYDMGPLDRRELKEFIVKRCKQGGKWMSLDTLDLLIDESGYFNKEIDYGLYHLAGDLSKMMAITREPEITARDVRDCLSMNLEHDTFKMLDAVSAGNKAEAFSLLRDLMAQGTSPQQILASIAGQTELMMQISGMRASGFSMEEIRKRTGVHEFRLKKAGRFAERYPTRELRRMLAACFDTDERIKSGLLPGDMALELLIAGFGEH